MSKANGVRRMSGRFAIGMKWRHVFLMYQCTNVPEYHLALSVRRADLGNSTADPSLEPLESSRVDGVTAQVRPRLRDTRLRGI